MLMKKSSILFSDIVTFKKVEEKDQRLLYSEFQTLINSFFIYLLPIIGYLYGVTKMKMILE